MSSVIAAPIGGRSLRTRALVHESPREHERTRLRRYLRVTTLQALENIAGSTAESDAAALIAIAADAADAARTLAGKLADVKGGTAVAELQREVGAMLHDTALQALEYLACDGYQIRILRSLHSLTGPRARVPFPGTRPAAPNLSSAPRHSTRLPTPMAAPTSPTARPRAALRP